MRRNVLVALLLPLLLATPVRADDDAVADAKKSIGAATRLINDGCFGAARTALSAAEAKVNALGELERGRDKGRPGLAPGRIGFADRRLVDFGLQPGMAWTGVAPASPA